MKKLAIIGASYLQLPLVKKAKEMELETICFAWEEGAVCKDIADQFFPISIIDKEAVLQKCQVIGIDGVTTIALRFGFYIVIISILLALYYLIRYLVGGIAVSGFTTLVISVWLIAGIMISIIGMVGIYVGRVFDKVKGRPVFIIKDKINL